MLKKDSKTNQSVVKSAVKTVKPKAVVAVEEDEVVPSVVVAVEAELVQSFQQLVHAVVRILMLRLSRSRIARSSAETASANSACSFGL